MAEYGRPSTYGFLTPEERWKKWEADKPRAENAIWGMAPGYDFIPEVDLPMFHSLFLDSTHSSPPVTPLYGYLWVRHCGIGTKWVNINLSLPNIYGWEWRFKDGGVYTSFLIVRDEEERKQREVKFKEAIRPYIDDFSGMWEKNKKKLTDMYDRLKQFNPDKATVLDLLHHNWELDEAFRTMYEIHFFGMQSSYSGWILLEEECKKRFGINDQSAEFQDMMRGFDNEIYQVDKELWLFSKQAVEMGLGDIFKENEPEAIIPKLEQEAKGKEWVKKFMDFLQVHGWRMVRFTDLVEPYWLEKPSIPMKTVRDHIVSGSVKRKEYILDEKRKELSIRREKAVKGMLDRVPPQDRGWFSSLIKLGQYATSYSEEHDLYCELTIQAIMRRGYLAIGKKLAENGTVDRPDDIFMLNPWEIESVILLPHLNDLRWITRPRRATWERWVDRFVKEGEWRPPVYTDRPGGMNEAVEKDLLPSLDPICIKIIIGELPAPRPELKADIMGICGCPGEVEGLARIIVNYEDLGQLRPGEILVCPGTNPAWTVAFGIAAGVIGDRGGTLSHTAIIGREYGMPTIVNTFVACEKIKTGQRIRMDATQGAVYLLDK
jgi:pyruvate,water dikinase